MADALDSARRFLESLHRFDLSTLLGVCSIAISQVADEVLFESSWHNVGEKDEAVVFAPAPVDAGLRALLRSTGLADTAAGCRTGLRTRIRAGIGTGQASEESPGRTSQGAQGGEGREARCTGISEVAKGAALAEAAEAQPALTSLDTP